jgi:hypothetical protein
MVTGLSPQTAVLPICTADAEYSSSANRCARPRHLPVAALLQPLNMNCLAIDWIHTGSFELFTDFGGDPHGPHVFGVDEADHVVDVCIPRPFERSKSGLGRKSMTPA